jgi:cytochrome d ubiquinol oxidase subunit II
VALGNIARGIPLDDRFEFAGSFLGLLTPYPLLVGVTTVALFAMHGSIYLVLKTEGALQARLRGWVRPAIAAFALCYVATTAATLLTVPHMVTPFRDHPWLAALPLCNLLVVANIPREIHRGREFFAFLSSCGAMFLLMAIFGLGMYPDLIHAAPDGAFSLTVHNAASSEKTLGIMLVIAAIGMPLVLGYTAIIYWVFRGKVRLDSTSY